MALVVASFAPLASHPAPASASPSATYLMTLDGWPDYLFLKRYFIVTPPPGEPGGFSLSRRSGFAQDQPDPVCDVPQCTGWYWAGHGPDGGPKFKHIDMWVGGKNGNVNAVINCEDSLTQSGTVIVNPPSNEPVSSTPLFNSSTNTCFHP